MTASASAIPRTGTRPPTALLASARSLSETIRSLEERHAGDPEVAAVCAKWTRRFAELESHALAHEVPVANQ